MLDTNVCVEVIRGRGSNIVDTMEKHRSSGLCISVITLGELELGVLKSAKPIRNQRALSKFCGALEIRAFGRDAAAEYANVRAQLERAGRTIGPLDTLIAGHSLAAGAVLVTNNTREFSRVEGLTIENWS